MVFHPCDEFSPAELAEVLNTDRAGIKRLMNQGKLPAPIRISKRVFRWRWQDIESAVYRLREETQEA